MPDMNLAVPPAAAVENPVRALAGVDFTSAPRRGKPIVWAWGAWQRPGLLRLERFEEDLTPAAFAAALRRPGPWLAAFDMPFGLPRELLATLGWPADWAGSMAHYASLSRPQVVETFSAFCDARPAGSKFAHRACDAPAGSSSSMKWVNPPVAYMLHAGMPLLIDAGVEIPGLQAGDPARVALEAYPGLLAREILGRRSYKSDEVARQTADRFIARKDLIAGLEAGATRLGLRLALTHAQRDLLAGDASGDSLDAVLCLVQAAWAARQHARGDPRYGLPAGMDTLEGWIVSAPFPGA